jgi:hypothetical protein
MDTELKLLWHASFAEIVQKGQQTLIDWDCPIMSGNSLEHVGNKTGKLDLRSLVRFVRCSYLPTPGHITLKAHQDPRWTTLRLLSMIRCPRLLVSCCKRMKLPKTDIFFYYRSTILTRGRKF